MRKILALTAFFFALNVSPALAIDCPRAETRVELLICSDDELIYLDGEMSQLYFELRNFASRREARYLLNNQRRWLRSRSRCGSVSCMRRTYSDRIDAFREVLFN